MSLKKTVKFCTNYLSKLTIQNIYSQLIDNDNDLSISSEGLLGRSFIIFLSVCLSTWILPPRLAF